MTFHLLTKDSNMDYPRVGWLPDLPSSARSLWERFGLFHAAEYPEVILEQKDGLWRLYLGAVDSGRVDYMGARIRVSFYLSGSVGDSQTTLVLKLLSAYVQETLCGMKDGQLTLLLRELIEPGQPSLWPKFDAAQKTSVIDHIVSALGRLPDSVTSPAVQTRWYGGVTVEENRAAFIAFCRALLNGTVAGIASSLANLSVEEVGKALSVGGVQSADYAVLLTTEADKVLPLKKKENNATRSVSELPSKQTEPVEWGHELNAHDRSPSGNFDDRVGGSKEHRLLRGGTIGVILLLSLLLLKACVGRGHKSDPQHLLPKTITQEVQK